MSDQTDIERTIRELITNTSMKAVVANRTDLREVLEVFAQELNGLRDEETARLKEEVERLRNILDEGKGQSAVSMLFQENDNLRARLAEATADAEKLRKITAEAWDVVVAKNARQLALESQCQRMRDALTKIKGNSETNGYVHAGIYEEASAVLSAPLDLELLNRAREVLTQVLESARPNKIVNPTMWGAWLRVESLLKSLSPAP